MKIVLQKLFNSRLFTMAISLLIAIVAWVVVVATISTEGESVIKGVPVNFSYDSASYTVNGLDIVSSPSATVDLRIQGPRSYVNNLSRDDFLVYPNYSSVRGAGEYELSLVVKVQDNNWESNQASILNDKNLPTVSVVFDTVITKTFAITTDTSNVQIADGYIFAGAQCSPSEVTLEGPEGEIDKVDKIVAPLYVEGARSESVTQSSTLVAVDSSGQKLDLKYVTFSTEISEVTLQVQQRKELPLRIEFTNVPAGFDITNLENRLTLSEETLVVSGDSRRLDGLTELTVAYFDLTKFTLDKIYSIPITLPDGIRSQENISSITATFDYTGLAQKTISVTDIRTANIPENYTVTPNSRRVNNVTLIGPAEELDALASGSVIAQINGEDLQLSAGVMNVPVRILVPGSPNIFATGSYTIECQVSAGSEE